MSRICTYTAGVGKLQFYSKNQQGKLLFFATKLRTFIQNFDREEKKKNFVSMAYLWTFIKQKY